MLILFTLATFILSAQSTLSSLPTLTPNANNRMVSPENPTGRKGQGAMAVPNPADPDLAFSTASLDRGQEWKVRPFVKVKPLATVTLMDVSGPGVIQHICMANGADWQGNGRASVLRFYWDGEPTPSIEVPMTDFFAVGHDLFARVNSAAVVVLPKSALNCYWPMPFRKSARADASYFHAQWRRAVTDRGHPDYTILEAKGEGRYVGTFLAWTQLSSGWFGEGEAKFYIDGDSKFPTLNGTGTEDYFGGSYGFLEVFST